MSTCGATIEDQNTNDEHYTVDWTSISLVNIFLKINPAP